MRALVLDFDGVIADSARESFAVAWRSYHELSPGSPLAARPSEACYPAFLQLMPLGNRAEDYGTALAAIEQGRELPDQASYDRFRAEQDEGWLATYHERFYAVRAALAMADPAGWRALMPPYRTFVDLLRRRAGDVSYAIATSKDRRSVEAMLADYGVADLFPAERILDKQAGRHKSAHLERLRELLALDFAGMTFVDDKVNHLDAVAPLGVRCGLAAWGYNGPRERELAARRGYLVCDEHDAERLLFGRP